MAGRVVVIGAGLSGCLAALAAREQGAGVTVVSRAEGRSSLSGGLISLAPADPDRPEALAPSLRKLAAEAPRHPYAGFEDLAGGMEEALRFFQGRAQPLYPASVSSNTMPKFSPTEFGTLAGAFLSPRSFAALETASALEGAVVGALSGYPSFRARAVAAALSGRISGSFGGTALPVIPIAFAPPGGFFHNSGDLARALDEERTLDRLAAAIQDALKGKPSPALLLLPPVLGLARYDSADRLSRQLGFPVREAAAAQNSIPGQRLMALMRARLLEAGVTLAEGGAVSVAAAAGRVTALTLLRRDGKQDEIGGGAFVLAAGKFIGGGIVSRGRRFIEPLFGLPLWVGGRQVEEEHAGRLTDPDFTAAQRLSSLGIAADASGRALGLDGAPLYANLFAAGQVLGGFDPVIQSCAEGVDILTGRRAGRRAAEAA